VQTETEKELSIWQVISELEDSWCFDNYGFDLTLKILEKDGKYRLFFSQPVNCTEDVFCELSGRPIRGLKELETLSKKKYKALVGTTGYGETNLKGIVEFLGVEIISQFELSNLRPYKGK
jgi:hypothetical protein